MSDDPHRIADLEALRRLYKPAMDGAVRKVMRTLDKHARAYLAHCPFAVISTSNAQGLLDASPKGGPPGFMVPLDDAMVLIPDWPGNNRLDSIENILSNPRIGVLAFLPGMNEMLRFNGRAEITTDPALRQRLAIDGKRPISVIKVYVEDVYLHCARALQRSALWDPARQIDRKSFPSMGTMLADQIVGYDGAATDLLIEARKDQLYGER